MGKEFLPQHICVLIQTFGRNDMKVFIFENHKKGNGIIAQCKEMDFEMRRHL